MFQVPYTTESPDVPLLVMAIPAGNQIGFRWHDNRKAVPEILSTVCLIEPCYERELAHLDIFVQLMGLDVDSIWISEPTLGKGKPFGLSGSELEVSDA